MTFLGRKVCIKIDDSLINFWGGMDFVLYKPYYVYVYDSIVLGNSSADHKSYHFNNIIEADFTDSFFHIKTTDIDLDVYFIDEKTYFRKIKIKKILSSES